MHTSPKETPTGGCNHPAGANTQENSAIIPEVNRGRKHITMADVRAATAARALERIAAALERRNEIAAVQNLRLATIGRAIETATAVTP